MKNPPWDQRLARVLVKPLVKSPVTPNQLTIFTLLIALGGAGMLALGETVYTNWGVGLFVLARFMDHFGSGYVVRCALAAGSRRLLCSIFAHLEKSQHQRLDSANTCCGFTLWGLGSRYASGRLCYLRSRITRLITMMTLQWFAHTAIC